MFSNDEKNNVIFKNKFGDHFHEFHKTYQTSRPQSFIQKIITVNLMSIFFISYLKNNI